MPEDAEKSRSSVIFVYNSNQSGVNKQDKMLEELVCTVQIEAGML